MEAASLKDKVRTLQTIRGANKKAEFIKDNAEDEAFRTFLYYALNPFVTFKTSEDSLRSPLMNRPDGCPFPDIFTLCKVLSRMKAMDSRIFPYVQEFLHIVSDEDERELYIQLLAKTIRLGMTAKTVNKIIPGLIPDWEVQQAFPIDKCPIPEGEWFSLTQKLNGVRATYYEGNLIARSGIPYEGLAHIQKALEELPVGDLVFDGELTLADKGDMSDNEAFRVATGIVNSETEDKTRICFTVFDVVPVGEFDTTEGFAGYKERRRIMDFLQTKLPENSPVRFLPVLYSGTDQSKIPELLDQMVREDKEGLVANLDIPYKRRRHRGVLKIKRFYTMDLPIVACEEGSGRLAGTLGAFVLDYKGNHVRVGSGFSDEQRADYWNRRDELPGTLCEVKYKEISSDKRTGAESLQFPVFIQLRTDKSEVSYG